MTESVFRKRLLQLWLSFTVVGLLVSRILAVTTLRVATQKTVFVAIWLGALGCGVALYAKGSVTDHAEREQILKNAHVKGPGWVVLFCSMFMLLMMQASVALVIWTGRTSTSWTDLALLPVQLLFALGITARVFEIVRNAHLSRMENVG